MSGFHKFGVREGALGHTVYSRMRLGECFVLRCLLEGCLLTCSRFFSLEISYCTCTFNCHGGRSRLGISIFYLALYNGRY